MAAVRQEAAAATPQDAADPAPKPMPKRPTFSPYKGWRAEVWLFLSSFGIAFAVLSWLELANLDALRPILVSKLRGLFAVALGIPFYFIVGREMERPDLQAKSSVPSRPIHAAHRSK